MINFLQILWHRDLRSAKPLETFRGIKTPEAALKVLGKRNTKNIVYAKWFGHLYDLVLIERGNGKDFVFKLTNPLNFNNPKQ